MIDVDAPIVSADLRSFTGERLASAGILTTLADGYEVCSESRFGHVARWRITETEALRIAYGDAHKQTSTERCLAAALLKWWDQNPEELSKDA